MIFSDLRNLNSHIFIWSDAKKAVILRRQTIERLAVFYMYVKSKQTITMKTKILALVLGAILTMPCVLRAEEVVIELMEVIQMETLLGDDPLDGPTQSAPEPTRPASFRATIDGNLLSITKQEESIPFAQATVVNATTGGIVLNQQFTTSLSEQIGTPGVYALHIETAGGALVGQFIVQ